MNTLNEYDMRLFIKNQFPEILGDTMPAKQDITIYQLMSKLVIFTVGNVKDHNFLAVKKCLLGVEDLYDHGNRVIQTAIENIYVYSFTNMLLISKADKQKLLSIIPIGLYTIYIN
jgi:hypothetical protein